MTHCDLCGMHMPAGRLIKNRRTERCDKNTQMLWRRRDVAIAYKRLEETLSITGEDEAEYIEGVEVLKYLRRLIYWLDDNCPEFLQNTRKAGQMWVWLGKILRTEGEEPDVLAKLLQGHIDGAVVRGRYVGAANANGAESGRSSCGVPTTCDKVEGKKAKGRFVAKGDGGEITSEIRDRTATDILVH